MTESTNTPNPMVTWIIWGAYLNTAIIFVVVLFFVTDQANKQVVDSTLESGLYGIAGLALLGSLFMRKRYLSPEAVGNFYQDNQGEQERFSYIFKFNLFNYALNEVAAVCGLVLGLIANDPNLSYPLITAQFVLTLFMYPRFKI